MHENITREAPTDEVGAKANTKQSNVITEIEKALNGPFKELKNYSQFIIYKLVPDYENPSKMIKKPLDHRSGYVANPHDAAIWTDAATAIATAKKFGNNYGVGFVFTESDPFFFLDIDKAFNVEKNEWSALAIEACQLFPNAALEISQSRQGLHIFGRYIGEIKHRCKNMESNSELYHMVRFVALTGIHARGDISHDCTGELSQYIKKYFKIDSDIMNKKINLSGGDDWNTEPVSGWGGYRDDDDNEVIARGLSFKSANSVFGNTASLQDLWEVNEDKLGEAYPSGDERPYDYSSADAALAQHLAWLTGNNHQRILNLMLQSGLYREKYERPDYLPRTIRKACRQQTSWFQKDWYKASNTVDQIGYISQPVIPQSSIPIPLPELPNVIAFDYSWLPDVLRLFVEDIAYRMQCPADFPAVAVYVMLATVVGRKIGIRPKKMDNWTVIPNLWGAVVGSSGVKKSPALKEALASLRKLQSKAHEEFNNAMSVHEELVEFSELKKSANKSKARRACTTGNDAAAIELLKSVSENDAPTLKRYSTNDATVEALGELMIENPDGVMMFSDELIGTLKRLDAPGQESARAFFLTAANGDQPYTSDRIQRGKHLHIKAACLSILGGIQPGVLADYVRQATDGGAGADGLLQRFSAMVYPDVSVDYKYIDIMPQVHAQCEVSELTTRLDKLRAISIGAEVDAYDKDSIPFLRFDDAAQALFAQWDIALGIRLRSGEEHPALVSHFSKYPKALVTIALLNHLCDETHGAVSVSALTRAIAYINYLESHARRIYSFATRPDIEAAKTLLKRLASSKLSNPFTAREVSQKGWAGLATSAKAEAAIKVLLEYGHLSEEKTATVGRPTTLYHWYKADN